MVPAFHHAPKPPRPGFLKRVCAGFCGALWLAGFATGAAAETASSSGTDESLRGPDITIIAQEDRVIYEFRQGSELRMIRVVPSIGRPYYLVPRDSTQGFGDLDRADMLVPSWTILEF